MVGFGFFNMDEFVMGSIMEFSCYGIIKNL